MVSTASLHCRGTIDIGLSIRLEPHIISLDGRLVSPIPAMVDAPNGQILLPLCGPLGKCLKGSAFLTERANLPFAYLQL